MLLAWKLMLPYVLGFVHIVAADMELCSKSEICVTQCGEKCLSQCAAVDAVDVAGVTKAQACRKRFLEAGGVLKCSEESGECATSPTCVEDTSDSAQCFLTCEYECAHEFTNAVDDMVPSECGDMCLSECSRLLKSPNKEGDVSKEEEDEEEDAEEESAPHAFTAQEVSECVTLCSIASECLAADEAYEYDTEDVNGRARVIPVASLISEPLKYMKSEAPLEWELSGSKERTRLLEALEDSSSPEAQQYMRFIEALGPEEAGGDDGAFMEGMNPKDLLAAMGMGSNADMDGMSEADMMQMIQMMMSGGGGMGGGGGYGDEYGGGGDMYGGMMGGGYGGFEEAEDEIEESGEYEDDFGE